MGWASASPPVASAFAGFLAAVEKETADAMSRDVRAVVKAHIQGWSGEPLGLGREWVKTAVTEPEAAAARLALLGALAPHQIDDGDVSAYRHHEPADRSLLALLAWSSAQAARRIGTWIAL